MIKNKAVRNEETHRGTTALRQENEGLRKLITDQVRFGGAETIVFKRILLKAFMYARRSPSGDSARLTVRRGKSSDLLFISLGVGVVYDKYMYSPDASSLKQCP